MRNENQPQEAHSLGKECGALCPSHCSVTVTRHRDRGNSYKREYLTGGLCQWAGDHDHHGRECGSRQPGMVH